MAAFGKRTHQQTPDQAEPPPHPSLRDTFSPGGEKGKSGPAVNPAARVRDGVSVPKSVPLVEAVRAVVIEPVRNHMPSGIRVLAKSIRVEPRPRLCADRATNSWSSRSGAFNARKATSP